VLDGRVRTRQCKICVISTATRRTLGHSGSLNSTLRISLCNRTYKVFKPPVTFSQALSCTLLQLRTSRDYLLPRTDSSLNRTNYLTYIAEKWTRITGNTCHVTVTHRCVTSPRKRISQRLRYGPCLQSCCLATR
jgi:hypothetical protein